MECEWQTEVELAIQVNLSFSLSTDSRLELSPRNLIPRRPSKVASQNSYSGCYVPICRLRPCKLASHRHFVPSKSFDLSSSPVDVSSRSWTRTHLRRKLTLLPSFSDSVGHDKEFQNLFHQYLAFDMPRIIASMAPPPTTQTPDQNIVSRQQGIAALGSSAPVYFLLFVSMAHLLELVRREKLEPDQISARLYGRLMRVLREKLSNFEPSEASDLVLSVLALSSFDMSLGNSSAVEMHRDAIQRIVSQVGVPYLGRSMAYVLSWDRLIAAYTAKPPLFAKMPDRQFIRTPKHHKKYGLGFELCKDRLRLDDDVQTLTSDVCRAIEIVEAENWTFRPDRLYRRYNGSEIQYLYYIRDVIQNTCIMLQAKVLKTDQRSKPILFAIMIIQQLVLGKNDTSWYVTSAANRLYDVLADQQLQEVWVDCKDALCWVMCVMISVRPWKKQDKAFKLFYNWVEQTRTIQESSNEDPPARWDGLSDLQAFVWSHPELTDKLSATLAEYPYTRSMIEILGIKELDDRDDHTIMIHCSVDD